MSPVRAFAIVLAALTVLIVVLLAAFAFVVLQRVRTYIAKFELEWAPRAKVSDVYGSLKTGDIILFVSAVHSGINSVFTQTFHSHVGMLVREGNDVHISETSLGVNIMPDASGTAAVRTGSGATLTPLLVRLKYYVGDCYILRLSRPLAPDVGELVAGVARRLQLERYPYPTPMQALAGMLGWFTESRHCFQHVAHLLDTAGLSPNEEPLIEAGFSKVCREISTLWGRQLPKNYEYARPVQLIYDIGTVAF